MSIRKYSPITKSTFPTVPLSYPQDEKGEFFVSEYYWFQFQRNPQPAFSLLPNKKADLSAISYPYSLTAFGRRDVIPQASILPIAVVAIEQNDLSLVFGKEDIPIISMKSLFINNQHSNLGEIAGDITEKEALTILITEMKQTLNINEIHYVGGFDEACKAGFIPYSLDPKKSNNKKFYLSKWSIFIIIVVILLVLFD